MTVFTLWSTKVYTECDASQPPTLRQTLTSDGALWSTAQWLVVTGITRNAWKFRQYVKMPDYIDCCNIYKLYVVHAQLLVNCILDPIIMTAEANPIDRWAITRCLREGSAITRITDPGWTITNSKQWSRQPIFQFAPSLQLGNTCDVHSTIHRKCEINEILHSIWTMENNIHVSYIVLLQKELLKILCGH